ncbi:sulfotransferase family protein [Actinomadura oligospora]|uniref:sulfotransferase family protein n=1 Tax=Actinomadura oligospora TaxID=111804 RepID=UPI00047B8AC7|nr:sulfotransferase family protein [Actinomadura oligospora]
MQVIGAGFGRTGTASLTVALEELGFDPCFHMRKVFGDPAQADAWQRASRGEAVDLPALLEGYRASVGWPGSHFWRQLVDHFPQAKVVLTMRDPQSWYESARHTIFDSEMGPTSGADDPRLAAMLRLAQELVIDGVFGGRMDDPAHAIEVFERHYADVRAHVPADRLLEFDVAQGWEPLCAFLDVPVPQAPFPHRNDRRQFEAFMRAGRSKRR